MYHCSHWRKATSSQRDAGIRSEIVSMVHEKVNNRGENTAKNVSVIQHNLLPDSCADAATTRSSDVTIDNDVMMVG